MFSRCLLKLHRSLEKASNVLRRSCHTLTGDHAHGFDFLGKHDTQKKVEALLATGAVEIDFTNYIQSGLLEDGCPVKKIYVNQLAANSPVEDRWNVGFAQVDGVISSCLFTVLDGHSGTMCAHALAWSILDYVAAAFLSKEMLMLAMHHWSTHDVDQPYHLARRLDLLASADGRRLGHAASAPSLQLSAHMRRCLQEYVRELVERNERNMDPEYCLTEAMLRIDDVLCSTHTEIDLPVGPPEERRSLPEDSTLARDLMRVALSGAVGITGRLAWKNGTNQMTELQMANVGDCGAVLLRLENPGNSPSDTPVLRAIPCSTRHQGSCNPNEVARVSHEHPENDPSDLFRDGGRLLGDLVPSRAFGNVRYKWPVRRIRQLSKALDQLSFSSSLPMPPPKPGMNAAPPDAFLLPYPYTSPPYLTAKPEVTRFEITPADRYLILATDGLWDALSSDEVAGIMQTELVAPSSPATRLLWNCLTNVPPSMARSIAQDLSEKPDSKRQPYLAKQTLNEQDRKALNRAFKLLNLPPGAARYYRDDITVMVIELFHPE